VTITGKFSQTDAYLWLAACLPDFPMQPHSDSPTSTYYFTSCFVGTSLVVVVGDNSVSLSSDNLSVITIIKEQLTSKATLKKIGIDIADPRIDDASWQRNLALLHPKIQEQYSIAQKNQLIDGLKEL
jgi:Bardet-Biedl syndrome 7 protein